MSARQLFVNESGALRAPWRVVVFCALSIACVVASVGILSPILTPLFAVIGARGVTTEPMSEAIGLIAGTALALRWVDKRPWGDVWLGAFAARPNALVIGAFAGALAIGVPTAILIGAHWLRDAPQPPGSWWAATFRATLLLAPAALVEELLSRGYLLSVLRDWWGTPWAVGVTSAAFGLLHVFNAGATLGSVALVMLAGVFLAVVLLATQSLYAAWVAHFAWNAVMAIAFHTAVSGIPLESPRYRYVDAGPDWATGGDWGPEGGVPAGLGMVGGMLALRRVSKRAEKPSRREAE